jgi:TolA-binding protein
VNSKSNRFASLGVIALLAGCHSAPVQPPRAPAPVVRASTPESKPVTSSGAPAAGAGSASSAAGVAAAPGTAAAAKTAATNGVAAANPVAAADSTPIPPRAAQQYSQALQMMKSNRLTDAELEFKQLTVA